MLPKKAFLHLSLDDKRGGKVGRRVDTSLVLVPMTVLHIWSQTMVVANRLSHGRDLFVFWGLIIPHLAKGLTPYGEGGRRVKDVSRRVGLDVLRQSSALTKSLSLSEPTHILDEGLSRIHPKASPMPCMTTFPLDAEVVTSLVCRTAIKTHRGN